MGDEPSERLQGLTAIITGGAQGIGAGLARVFAAEGCTVTSVDRHAAANVDFVGDVADPAFVKNVVDTVGRVDILINNAGEVWPTGPLDDWDAGLADFDQLVGSNLRGAFLFGRAVAPTMAAHGSGHIINMSSDHIKPAPETGWHHGHGAMDLYNACKWALNGLTFDWAKALRPHGVRVNNVCMGATDTEMLRSWIGSEPDPEYLATWMTPEGIAEVVINLINEGPGGRTGDNIGIWAGHPTVLPAVEEGESL